MTRRYRAVPRPATGTGTVTVASVPVSEPPAIGAPGRQAGPAAEAPGPGLPPPARATLAVPRRMSLSFQVQSVLLPSKSAADWRKAAASESAWT